MKHPRKIKVTRWTFEQMDSFVKKTKTAVVEDAVHEAADFPERLGVALQSRLTQPPGENEVEMSFRLTDFTERRLRILSSTTRLAVEEVLRLAIEGLIVTRTTKKA